jgi:uncharacterized protein with von Willebrand factor type A (vWA) domain
MRIAGDLASETQRVMLEKRMRGEEADFERFMHKYGHYFGDDIKSLDELLDRMAQQMAAMQSLMDSMSPEQREQLQEAMNAVMNDPGIQEEMQKLSQHLGQMMPENPYSSSYEFTGGEELSLQEAMRMMDQLREMEEMEEQLGSVRDWRDLENIDNDRIRELMGDDVSRDLEQLQQLTKLLEDAGYIERRGRGYELTPRGVRKIGQKALQDIFRHLNMDRIGQHEVDRSGSGVDRLDVEPGAGTYDCDGPPHTLVDLALGKDVDNCSPGELGARTVELLEAVYRSAESGALERVYSD